MSEGASLGIRLGAALGDALGTSLGVALDLFEGQKQPSLVGVKKKARLIDAKNLLARRIKNVIEYTSVQSPRARTGRGQKMLVAGI